MNPTPLHVSDFEYDLPPDLIAQRPAPSRDASRLMIVDRSSGTVSHDTFSGLPARLRSGDVLVLNRSRVIKARLHATRETGGVVELLLVREVDGDSWEALARPSRKLRPGMRLTVNGARTHLLVERRREAGEWIVQTEGGARMADLIERAGELPLPPYIRGASADGDRYQTVYADRAGSVAAPTAGLHFTDELLESLRCKGLQTYFVTLHVGPGTFRPVKVDNVRDHTMHAEWGEVPGDVAGAINRARSEGRRVVAVGTTTTRLLETAWSEGRMEAWSGMTDRFIYPGYRFTAIDALITNFHLPRSTLLMLVSAFAGRDLILSAYAEAVRQRYRFFSFGDAMLIE